MVRLSCLLCELKDKCMLSKRVAKYLLEGKYSICVEAAFPNKTSGSFYFYP